MEPEIKAAASSSSGLEFHLHPLVLINISDHHTRTKVNGPPASTGPQHQHPPAGSPLRVVGCLLGQQVGRSVDIRDSFEVGLLPQEASQLDFGFLHKKLEQYKQTFPDLDVVGWYATGSSLGPIELDIQRKITDLNESPVLLLLDPFLSPSTSATGANTTTSTEQQQQQQDLPVGLYETEVHVVNNTPSLLFTKASFHIATSEAERIGIDQVAKLLPSGGSGGTDQLTSHLTSLHSATTMLVARVEVIADAMRNMASGAVPFNPAIARQCAAFSARLPAADVAMDAGFVKSTGVESCDALLAVVLAGVTAGCKEATALCDRYNLAYERMGPASRRGGGGKSGGGGGSKAALTTAIPPLPTT